MVENVINRKERFATEGIRFQRHNGDGTIPTPQRFLGFANTTDLSAVLKNNKAPLTIKINGAPAVTKDVTFDAEDDENVTVQEAVDALNDADFPDIVFEVDAKTERLKGRYAPETNSNSEPNGSPNDEPPAPQGRIIQVVGKLAAALDFGNCLKHGGNGLEVISFFDDETISIGLPKDIKDKEEIDVEGAKGTITRMIIGAMVQGLSPVVTLKEKDYYLLELIQGGDLNRETGTYNPPLSNESDHPSFWAEIFSPIYSKGSNKLSDIAGYERMLLRTMVGMEGDVPIDAKAWAQYAFNLVATEYTDENSAKFPAWEEQTLSATQFDALNVKKVKI